MDNGANRARVVASLVALYLVWGSTYLANRVGLESMPPLFMGGARFLVAGSILYAGLRLGGAAKPTFRQWRGAALTAVFLLVLGNGLLVVGQQWVSSGVSAVLVSTMPLWVAIFGALVELSAAWRRGEKPKAAVSRFEWLGLLLGFGGALLLNAGGGISVRHAGSIVVLLAPMCWALGSLLSRAVPLPEGSLGPAAQMLLAGPMMLVSSLVFGERLSSLPSARSLFAFAYLVVFGSILGFSAFAYLIRATRPAIATSYAYVNPLVAIALGASLGGEPTGPTTWLAALVVIAGVVLLHASRARVAARAA